MSKYRIIHGDCIAVMQAAKPESVHAIVCDPPYGIEFMGKDWDSAKMLGQAGALSGGLNNQTAETRTKGYAGCDDELFGQWCEAWATEALRVLKPGGHLLAFGGTRMYHWLAVGIERAGFEIRDSIAWMYGSGFPKSHNVGRGIDKMLGNERQDVYADRDGVTDNQVLGKGLGVALLESRPGSAEAAQWDGWGTALKPAMEPIVVARKPLRVTGPSGRQKKGTVAANTLEHGVGAYNIDGCRIATTDNLGGGAYAENPTERDQMWGADAGNSFRRGGAGDFVQPEGRWPANVILDEDAAALLDEQSGTSRSTKGSPRGTAKKGMFANSDFNAVGAEYNDQGGASRFFYVAKAPKKERQAGLEGMNVHPTVKPITLMRYLVRLVTPPGGQVLDPFMGSGTTGIAALQEGFRFIGIEREAEYVQIATARIAHHAPEAVTS